MAVSPLVVPPGSAERSTATTRSKLSAAQASNGTTPEPPQGSNGISHDLAEQMNEEEKNKYVKGLSPLNSPFRS
jgi:cyclin-dependent kinase 7